MTRTLSELQNRIPPKMNTLCEVYSDDGLRRIHFLFAIRPVLVTVRAY